MDKLLKQTSQLQALTAGGSKEHQALTQSYTQAIDDPYLAGVPNSMKQAPATLVTWVALNGSAAQRVAINKHFTIDDGLHFQDLKQLASKSNEHLQIILDLISKKANELALSFGDKFKGSTDELALAVFEKYGSLTMLDLIKFTEQAKAGDFRGEYQNVASRGINREYYLIWLDQYMEKKGQAWDSYISNRRHQNENQVDPRALTPPAEAKITKENIKLLEDKANELRDKQPQRTGYLLLHDFFVTHYMRVIDQESPDQVVEQQADQIIEKVTASWRAEHEARDAKEIKYEDYARAKAKSLHFQLRKLVIVNDSDYITQALLRHAKQLGSTEALVQKLAGDKPGAISQLMGRTAYVVATQVAKRQHQKFKQRYLRYLKASVEAQQAPLKKKEYLAYSARCFVYRLTGQDPLIDFLTKTTDQ